MRVDTNEKVNTEESKRKYQEKGRGGRLEMKTKVGC